MERVRKFWIWARSELGIGHDVRRHSELAAFGSGGIRIWGRNRAVKTNRLVLSVVCWLLWRLCGYVSVFGCLYFLCFLFGCCLMANKDAQILLTGAQLMKTRI